MKDLDTMTVSKVGQSTLPKWWRDSSGLSEGGVVEVRPMHDGKNSIILTPKPVNRRGAIGLLELLSKCPAPIPLVERHNMPFK
jgi:AbrB family looped-hinge helix DNA binding protein